MADQPKHTSKRGRPKLPESERKRRKLHRKISFERSRIYVGNEIGRWNEVKRSHNLSNDREVASFLIDSYRNKPIQSSFVATAGTSKMTSTPVQVQGRVRTPSLSEVSGKESSDDREGKAMSGFEELSAGSTTELESLEPAETAIIRPRMKTFSSSFVDPFQVSIDIETDDEDEEDVDDSEYEPSVLVTSILPTDIEKESEDVAYEEAEFGLEVIDLETEDSDRSDTDDITEGISVVKSADECASLCNGIKCMVFLSQLKQLANMNVSACMTCNSRQLEMVEHFVGSAVYFKWVCKDGHVTGKWCSQPLLNKRMHSGDFLICSTILTSGNNYGKMELWASMLHLKFPSAKQFHGIQGKYLVPTIDSYWERHQEELLRQMQTGGVIVMGDGRNDTPGHCAQYCSYSFMEEDTKKILTLKTIDKRMTDRKSGNMEKFGFQAAMEELKEKGVKVVEVVTDAHLGIGALMKSDYKTIKHSHDIWHAAKNLGKKLSKVALKKGNKILLEWNCDIVNHFWFSCKTATNYKQFMGIWCSVLHHIVNEHEWILSHSDDGMHQCLHGPLENQNKPWLHRKQHAHVLKDLAGVVMDKRFLNKVTYYLNFRSTADLEGFHQHILMYCAKRFAYTPPVYRVRNLLAAIDHNMHANRPHIINKDGSVRLQRVWNKKSGRWSVYEVKEKKKYHYMDTILQEAITLRLSDKEGIYKKRMLKEDDPRRLSKHLAPVTPKPTRDIHEEQKSRFT